jgi:hypothetical protein
MAINFNPNLPPNDSLTPEEIQAKVRERNAETQELAKQAYITGGVPISAADNAAKHSSITRRTPEAKKAIKDAGIWWKAKNDC